MLPLNKRRGPRPAIIIGVVGLFVIAGIGIKLYGSAASATLIAEVERGIKSGNVSTESSSDASGGAAVKFGKPGDILFEDDFNGPAGASFDKSKWGDYSGCSYNSSAFYGNIQCGDNETLDGQGNLVLPATPTAGSSIMTGDKFRFQYGTMSAWMKMPKEVGYWPAFWSLNSKASGDSEPPVGEIDVVEFYSTWPTGYHVTVHNWNWGPTGQAWSGPDDLCVDGADLTGKFNKYSAKVEPGKISYFFNDKPCGTVVTKERGAGKQWAFGPDVTRGNWLILTNAIGGAGGQQKPATEPSKLLVDRVEVRAN